MSAAAQTQQQHGQDARATHGRDAHATKPLTLFPGCTMAGTGAEYGHSMLAVLEALGSPVQVLEDWNCCGATASRTMDSALTARLCGRNLALAARKGCDVLVNCAACYNNLAFSAAYLREKPEAWDQIGLGRPAEDPKVVHLLSVLTSPEMLQRLAPKVTRPLNGMKLACYYGCLLVRPGGYTAVDDPEDPQTMDVLMRACGAATVDWAYKTDCCGGSFALSNQDVAVELTARLFRSALEQGAGAIVTACPMCHMNLDSRQKEVGEVLGRDLQMPIYYITELLAEAMGLEGADRWLRRHLTDARLKTAVG